MRFILLIFASILLVGKIQGQCDAPFFRYTATLINGISLIDTGKIVAVGDNGYIIKSNNGGQSWKNITTFSSSFLKAVQFPTDTIGYVVGSSKTILKTEDQGESWFPLYVDINEPPFSAPDFNDLYFFNKNRGYVAGDFGNLAFTNDGGRSWKDTVLGFQKLNGITFINDSTGFVCGMGSGLYKTINSGQTWLSVAPSFLGVTETFTKVRFVNSSTGFAVGDNGLCLKTTDAGIHWTKINTPSSAGFLDICFLNETKGFIAVAGSSGLVLQTNDGGISWSVNYTDNTLSSYNAVNTDPAKKKVMMAGGGSGGDTRGYNGRSIISSTDGGATFVSLSGNAKVQYNDLFFLNDSTGYIAGVGGLAFKTTDFGESWKPLHAIPAVNGGNPVKKIFFVDPLYGFAVSDNIYKTQDGGTSWIAATTPGDQSQYFASQLYFANPLKGFVQDYGSMYKTVNGGNSWTKVAASINGFRDFTVTPIGKIFSVGAGGEAAFSTDEASTWTNLNLNTSKLLTTVYFYSNDIGFIGTDDTTIFKTTDGGNNWLKINSGTTVGLPIRSFHFVNDKEGYLVCYSNGGGYSSIYKTTNGGLSWIILSQVPGVISKIDGFKTLYAAGADGIVLKTDTDHKPVMPGYLYGPDSACIDSKSLFTTGTMTEVNYNWSLTEGGITSVNVNMDTVLWNGAGLHTLSLSVSNACGVSPARIISTDVILFKPVITMQDSLLTATEGVSYQWYSNGYPISTVSGGQAKSIVVDASSSYSVDVKSPYGCIERSPAVLYSATVVKSLCPGYSTSLVAAFFADSFQWQMDDGTGFKNITDTIFYTGTQTYTLQLNNISSQWYGYKFKCITNWGTADIYQLKFRNSWFGLVDTAWENPANWGCGFVPDSNTDVILNAGTVVISSNVTVRSLTLKPSANLVVQPGKTLTVTH
ncbi:MAG: YCF48-related protein [Ferruginibacter sp.]